MTLHAPYDPENIFAKILHGEMPAIKLYEDDHILSFMDVFPQSRGHNLTVPKSQARNILDIEPAALSPLIKGVQKIALATEKALGPDGLVVTQFNGAPAGQTVFHLHFHIIPRYQDQNLAAHHSGQMADMDELETIAAKIRAKI